MKLSRAKSELSESDPCYEFAAIKRYVEIRKEEAVLYAETVFGDQIYIEEARKRVSQSQLRSSVDLKRGFSYDPLRAAVSANTLLSGAPLETILKEHHRPSANLITGRLFSLDGSMVVGQDEFEANAPEFFRKSRRAIRYRGRVHLRGVRYTISSNPTFELRQKLKVYREDFEEGLSAIIDCDNYIYKIAIADYVKNAILTLLNAFLYDEKIGRYKLRNVAYQSQRNDGQNLGQAAVDMFFGVALRASQLSAHSISFLMQSKSIYHKLEAHILSEYEKGEFSSRHITRPEASHPLVIAGAAISYAIRSSIKAEVIVGMPAGSTELAFAHATAQRLINRRLVQVVLFPVSLHSIKEDFDNHTVDREGLGRFVTEHKKQLGGKRVAIVDDNSSTGQTIQLVADAISSLPANRAKVKARIEVAIAEADTIRSDISKNDRHRPFIVDRQCYQHSVNILPVSRSIAPRRDIKELLERRKMVRHIKDRYLNSKASLPQLIIGKVYIDVITGGAKSSWGGAELHETIRSFRKTFLSNFFPAPVVYHGKQYQSVEHAYQAMKFAEGAFDAVSDSDIESINRRLAPRGVKVSVQNLSNLFADPFYSAGTSKIVGNQLRILGFVRNDWDDVKTVIMSDLLVQKFSDPRLYAELVATRGKFLMEGNDWGDTYWGVSNDRGRNMLGRMLMAIRELTHVELENANLCLLEEHAPA